MVRLRIFAKGIVNKLHLTLTTLSKPLKLVFAFNIFFMLFFPRCGVLLGKPLDQELEIKLSDTHAKLISRGFYSQFREVVDKICQQLRVNIDTKGESVVFYNISIKEINLSLHQIITLQTLNSLKFKKSIALFFLTKRKIIFPIPKNCRKELRRELFMEFNEFLCGLLYAIYLSVIIWRSFFRFLKYLLLFHKPKQLHREAKDCKESILIANPYTECFPSDSFDSHNFIDWLNYKIGERLVIFHDNPNHSSLIFSSQKNPIIYTALFSEFVSIKSRIRILTHMFQILARGMFQRNTLIPLICQLDDFYLTLVVQGSEEAKLLRSVYFTNTALIRRPIWSLFLEKVGVEVILIHYSASAEPSESFGSSTKDGVWHLSSWSCTWVVDRKQSESALNLSPKYAQQFEIVGVPFWSGKKYHFEKSSSDYVISIFDTFIRTNCIFSASTIDDYGWHNIDLEWDFIFGILKATEGRHVKVLHKRKRPVRDRNAGLREINRKKICELFGNRYYEVPEDFSPESIVDVSNLVISKPISTVAFMATQRGCNAIFFDPTGNINKSDSALRGLFLASSFKELEDYFIRITTNNDNF